MRVLLVGVTGAFGSRFAALCPASPGSTVLAARWLGLVLAYLGCLDVNTVLPSAPQPGALRAAGRRSVPM